VPEAAVGYRTNFLRDMFSSSGLRITEPIIRDLSGSKTSSWRLNSCAADRPWIYGDSKFMRRFDRRALHGR